MRIAICVRTWGEVGGIGVYTRLLLPRLLDLDQRNEYIIFYQNRAHMGEFEGRANVREVYVPTFGKLIQIRTWIWDQMTMPWYAKREGVDVIFHMKFAIPLFTKCKTAMVLHGTERFVYPEFHQKGDLWFFRTIYPQYLKRASAILADSENARRDVIEKLKLVPDKVKTVHLAGDPACRILHDEKLLAETRKKYKLPQRFIVYVGHIYPGKNVGRLFEAFAKVRKVYDIELVMAGGVRWRYQEDLDLLETLGIQDQVKRLGYVSLEDIVALYNLAEMTVFPSIYECFPAIPLDANACGCPVVTSRTGGTPESAGDAAEYVDPFNVQDIADAMCRVLSDPKLRKELVEKGFSNARQFSWEKTAKETLAVLESLKVERLH